MQDLLWLPTLEITLPICLSLGLPQWTLAIFNVLIPAFVVSIPIWCMRWAHHSPLRWYEVIGFIGPIFVWGLVSLVSSHQLAMLGISFYFGLLLALIWLPGLPFLQLEQSERYIMIGILASAFALAAILCGATLGPNELGPEITLNGFLQNPDIIIW